ncbi:MAG TPA: PLP-dependent aminotransferase family protein [Candidatus Cybelea sp.]|nr:PLP-dependent aminotransferase family protein [Candidatus Cybelea sp.]
MAQPTRRNFWSSNVTVDSSSPVPKIRQVYEQLRDAIIDGRLSADDALPSTRELARALGVARNTIAFAYELLVAEGYAVSRGGAGTFVAHGVLRSAPSIHAESIEPRTLSQTADLLRVWGLPGLVPLARPFRPSAPAFDAFPRSKWANIVAPIVRDKRALWMTAGDPLGHPPLRGAIAQHLRIVRSFRCEPGQIMIVSGSQVGQYLSSLLLMNQDESMWIEDPGYLNARLTFQCRTSRLIPVPTDDSGIDIEAGKLLSPNPRVIYVTPAHQWPLGPKMSLQRRLALLEFAAQRDAWIIEDDYDGDLRYDGKTYEALCGLDEARRVIHLGTFTKTMFPGLRIGYIVLPPDLVDAFTAGHEILDRFPNTIAQAALAEFLETGAYARHLHDMRALYLERHELLREAISKQLRGFLEAKKAETGTFTVTELASGADDVSLVNALRAEGFDSCPLSAAYATKPAAKRGLLLGHAVAKPEEISKGVSAIARIASRWLPVGQPSDDET